MYSFNEYLFIQITKQINPIKGYNHTHMEKRIMKKKIYILEDNDDLRQLFAYILEDEHYEVQTFSNIALFNQNLNIPHLYLLDIMLPDGDGLDVCNRIKADSKTSSVPVIMMSAHKDIREVKEKCPGVTFIAKPFDIDHLIKSIANEIN